MTDVGSFEAVVASEASFNSLIDLDSFVSPYYFELIFLASAC